MTSDRSLFLPESNPGWLRRNGPLLRFVLFYAVLANIPYWILCRDFEVSHLGLFCAQYALVGLVALFAPRIVSSLLMVAAVLIDLLCGVSLSYQLPIRECLTSIVFVRNFSGPRVVFSVALVLLVLLTTFIVFFIPCKRLREKQRGAAVVCLTLFIVATVSADLIAIGFRTGHYRSPMQQWRSPDGVTVASLKIPVLVRFPLLIVADMAKTAYVAALRDKHPPAPKYVPSASEIAIQSAEIQQARGEADKPNVVLVLIESWGLSANLALRQSLTEPYRDANITSRYVALEGSVPFHGATIAGETRELCQNSIGFQIMRASASDLGNCLPDRLDALGYHSIAMHGMNRRLFNRVGWYSSIGFQEKWFHSNFTKKGLPDCVGPFTGTCDASIADLIAKRLSSGSSSPYFIHWITLNTHLPVPVPVPLANKAPCDATLSLQPDTPLCSWYQLESNVHHALARMVATKMARPTVFVFVGDHAPPFADPSLRSEFSQQDVPYLILIPRDLVKPSVDLNLKAEKPQTPAPNLRAAIAGN